MFSSDDLGSDQDAEYSNKVVSLPPTEVAIGSGELPVTQIACGMHHTGKFHCYIFFLKKMLVLGIYDRK